MSTNPHLAGKAAFARQGMPAAEAAWASLQARPMLATDRASMDAGLFCWGTIMAAAQAIDPTVNNRKAARDVLGFRRPGEAR